MLRSRADRTQRCVLPLAYAAELTRISPARAPTGRPPRCGGPPTLSTCPHRRSQVRFLRIIDRELQKVNRHVTSTISNIETTLAQLNRQLAASALFEATVQLEHSTNLVANEIVELQRFIRINELALRKITKKFDKNHNEITSTWLCAPPSSYHPRPSRTAACSCDAAAIAAAALALILILVSHAPPPVHVSLAPPPVHVSQVRSPGGGEVRQRFDRPSACDAL